MRSLYPLLLATLVRGDEIQTQLTPVERRRYDSGREFLERNAKNPDLTITPDGLQIRVLRDGDGLVHPMDGTLVETNQEGRNHEDYILDPAGENSFESTYMKTRQTMDHTINGTWKFLDRVLPMMVEGDKWEIFMGPHIYKKPDSRWHNGAFGHGHKCKDGHTVIYIIELLKIKKGKTSPRSDAPKYTAIADEPAHATWVAENANTPLVLGLLRQPLTSKLHTSFLSAARKVPGASFGMHAVSKYDAATKKFTTSPLETALKMASPSVITSTDGGASWTKCALPRSADIGAARAAIVDCATPASSNRDEL